MTRAALLMLLIAIGLAALCDASSVEEESTGLGKCIDFYECTKEQESCGECLRLNEESTNPACVVSSSYIDYFSLFFCTLLPNGFGSVGLILFACWAIFLVFVLVTTTESYFCPSLSKLSERMQLSNNVVGVTLLAVGNGAPDVFASLTASIHGNPELGISAVLGGAVFVSTLVLGIVIMIQDVKLARRPFVRDLIVLLLATGLVALAVSQGRIYLWQSIISIGFYIVYELVANYTRYLLDVIGAAFARWFMQLSTCQRFIIAVIVGRMLYQRHKRIKRESLGIIEEVTEEELLDMTEVDAADADLDDLLELSDIRSWSNSKQYYDDEEENLESIGCPQAWLRWATLALAWNERSAQGKLFFVLLSPLKLVQSLTIPNPSERDWAQPFMLLFPIAAPMIIFLSFGWFEWGIPLGKMDLPVWVVVLIAGVLCSIIIATTSSIREPPAYYMEFLDSPFYLKLFVAASFVMSSIWMYLVANELMCLLRVVGRILNITDDVLGLSVIAWSNSLVDLVANVIITKQGFGQMAVSACFAAPIFSIDILFGLGIAAAFELVINKGYDSYFSVEFSPTIIIALSALCVSVLSTLVVVPIAGWKVPPQYGLYLLFVYFVFAGLSLFTELGLLF